MWYCKNIINNKIQVRLLVTNTKDGLEFVSVYSQLDIQQDQMKIDKETWGQNQEHEKDKEEHLPNSLQAVVASAISFSLGIIVPIFNAAFIPNYKLRLAVNVAAMSLWLLLCGGIGTLLSTSPMVKSCPRVLLDAGWLWSLPFAKGTSQSSRLGFTLS